MVRHELKSWVYSLLLFCQSTIVFCILYKRCNHLREKSGQNDNNSTNKWKLCIVYNLSFKTSTYILLKKRLLKLYIFDAKQYFSNQTLYIDTLGYFTTILLMEDIWCDE